MSTSKKSNLDEIIWEDSDEKKSWWKKRSDLERKLVIALGVTVVVFLGIFIYMGIKPSEVQAETVCSTPECLVRASEVINLIDTSITPCDNFFKFTCGNLIKDTLDEEIKKEILALLQEPIAHGDHFMVKNQKALFQSCMNETGLDEESLPIVQHMFKELNDWPVVVGHKWRDRQFDWTEMVIKLSKKGYYDSMILDIGLHVMNNNLTIIVSPPRLTYVEKEHFDSYVKYMSDVAEMFGAEPNRAVMEMEKVLDFMDKLREISDKFWAWDNTTKATIREFQEEYDDVDWFKLIYNYVTPYKIASKDHANFPNVEYMEAFMTLMSKTPTRIQANYIIWRVVENLMPYLPKSFRELRDNYTCASNGIPDYKQRSELCESVVEETFLPMPAHILYMRKHLTDETREKLAQLYDSIEMQTMTILEESSWITDADKERLIRILNGTDVVIGSELDYSDDAVFEKYISNINKRSDFGSFLDMYLHRKKQRNEAEIRANEHRFNYVLNNIVTYTQPVYFLYSNKIVLPLGMLQKLFYNVDGPMYLTYGALGTAIAIELTHTLVYESEYADWANESLSNYKEQAKCYLKEFDEMRSNLDKNIVSFIDDGFYGHMLGIKTAYDAYQKWVEENGEEAVPVGIDYTPNQLFWIAALSNECYDKTENNVYTEFQKFYEKNTPVKNNKDFAADFDCSSESEMNPAEKCEM